MVYLEARDDLVATAAYQPVLAAASAARRFVRDTLRSWEVAGQSAGQDALVDDAVLLTSELVTNAVLHAGTPVQVTCRLLGNESSAAVEIAVLDRRPAQLRLDVPEATAQAAERTNGRGLQLPSQLATAWGVTYAKAAKAVWFRISLGGAGRAVAPGSPPGSASVPAQAAASESPASSPPQRAPSVAEGHHGEPGQPGLDDLLVSTVEKARDTIGADSAYLLLQADEDSAAKPGTPPAASAARALASGALSLVTVPLRVNGRVTGVLAAAAAEPGRFSENDASRLQDLADRSAPELEQARLSAGGPRPSHACG
jgi:anti-sigma regulatory factor (Ser/Thr protein kinase)